LKIISDPPRQTALAILRSDRNPCGDDPWDSTGPAEQEHEEEGHLHLAWRAHLWDDASSKGNEIGVAMLYRLRRRSRRTDGAR